jgi:Ammonium Transporter Family
VVWYDTNWTKSRDYIAHLDGYTVIPGGWVNRNYIQLAYQLSDSVTGFAYSFVGSCIILFVMDFIPGLSLRSSEDDEIMGIDDAEIGEFAVRLFSSFSFHQATQFSTIASLAFRILAADLQIAQYDFVEITRDVVSSTDGFNLSGFSKPSDVSSAVDRSEPKI